MSARPTRRTAISGVLAGVLLGTGCTRSAGRATSQPSAPGLDASLRAAAVAREQGLLLAYDAAAAAHPGLAARLQPLRDEHAAHLGALGVPETPVGQMTGRPGLPQLRSAERSAAAAHAAAALDGSRSLAAVLASLAASEASHAGALV